MRQRHTVDARRAPCGFCQRGGIIGVPRSAVQCFAVGGVGGQIRRLGAVGQQQVSRAAELGSVNHHALFFGFGAVGIGDGVLHLVLDGGAALIFAGRVLDFFVDLRCLHDFFLDGLGVRLVDDLFLDRDGLGVRHDVARHGLHCHNVIAGGGVLDQHGAGGRVHAVQGGFALGIGHADGRLHVQQGLAFSRLRIGGGRRRGGRGRRRRLCRGGRLACRRTGCRGRFRLWLLHGQHKQLHADILLHHRDLCFQRLVRLRRGGRGGGRRWGGRGGRGGSGSRLRCRLALGYIARRKHTGTYADGHNHRHTARRQLIDRQPRQRTAGKIFHRISSVEHSCPHGSFFCNFRLQ